MTQTVEEPSEQLRVKLWPRIWAAIQEQQKRMTAPEPPGFERVLALWIDLQQAMQTRDTHNHAYRVCVPWECVDRNVNRAWNRLTAPENSLALECLYYQMPEGPQMELARKALQVSREQQRDADSVSPPLTTNTQDETHR